MSRLIPPAAVAAMALGFAPAAHAADVIVRAGQDTAVDATAPKRHAGGARQLRLSARPLRRAFIRFDLRPILSPPARATVRLYLTSGSGSRVDVRSVVPGQRWSERRTTFRTAPAVGSAVRRSPRSKRAGWTAIDVTGIIAPGRLVDLAVTGLPRAVMASRESSHPPRLVITLPAPVAAPFPPAVSMPTPFASVAPVVELTGVDRADEGTIRSFAYAVMDPDSISVITRSCGANGEPVGTVGAAGFQCRFPDGPATSTVSVAADDGTGIGSDELVVTIANVAPSASLSNSGPITEGNAATISFSGATDPSPTDTAAGFRYAFRCDGSAFDPPPSYADASASASTRCEFAARGSRTARGRIIDVNGGFRDYTTEVTVTNAAPTLTAAPAQHADEGSATAFALGSLADAGDAGPWTVDVDWGDGTPAGRLTAHAAGPLAPASHVYADGPAMHTVTVSVTDSDNRRATATFKVTVDNVAPTVTLDAANPIAVDEGQTAVYRYTITDPGDDPNPAVTESCGAKGVWEDTAAADSFGCFFPDGPADSTVSVTADDGDSTAGSDATAAVRNVAPAVAPAAGQTAQTGTSTSIDLGAFSDPNPGDHPWTVVVDWGDGSPPTSFAAATPGPLGTRDHAYAMDGDHPVRVSVTDKDGGTGTGAPFNVRATAPASLTVIEDADPETAQSFAFTATGTLPFTLRGDGTPAGRRSFAAALGSMTVTQSPLPFWALDAIACTGDPDWVPTVAAGRVDLVVDAGEDIACTFANRRVASTVGGIFPESSSAIGPIADSNGNLYTVTELEARDPRPCLRKSSDGGRTWVEVDAANRPSYDDLESVSLVKDRAQPYRVHMLMQRSGTNRVSYNSFNMSDAPVAPDTWQTKNEVVTIPGANQNDPATDSTPKDEWVSLVQRSDGDLIAFYATSKTEPGPAGKEQIGYKVRSGGVWGPEQVLPGASPTDSYTQAVAVMGDGDVTHVFFKNDATERILYRTLDAGGAWGATKELTLHGTNSADHIIATPVAHLHVVRPSDSRLVERFVVGWKNSSDRTLHGAVVDDGVVVQPDTAISDVPVLSNPASTQSVQTVAGFAADDDADRVYAVYSDDLTHDLYYDVLPAGGTWGKDVKALGGYEVMEIQPVVVSGATTALGVLFDDNIGWETLGLDNVPRYTAIAIG